MTYRIALLAVCLVFGAVVPESASALDVRLRWSRSPNPEVVGYRVYKRPAGSSYGTPQDAGLPILQSDGSYGFVIRGLVSGTTYYFAVAAYTAQGKESALSNEISLGDVDPCVVDRCVGPTDCQIWLQSDGTPCDDGLFCNGFEWCAGGVCMAGSPPDCSDGIACTVDACDETLGRCGHQSKASCCTSSSQCVDTDPCTLSESCVAGKCVSTARVCPASPCTRAVCDPDGGCLDLSIPDASMCSDSSVCVEGGLCFEAGCGYATVVPAAGGIFSGTTNGTGIQAGSCNAGSKSPEEIFEFTPAVSGIATIETCGAGTSYDTVLYLRGGDCATGPDLACNDDACADGAGIRRASRLTPFLTAGRKYFIFVDGYNGAAGNFTLNVTPPATCSAPPVIPAAGGTFTGTTGGVGSEAGSCGGDTAPEAAFQWTPARSGTATIETCGANTDLDTVLYLRQGACANGAEVACIDDACPNASGSNYGSRIRASVTAGQTYFIVVDGYDGEQGEFSLTVTPP